MKNIKVLIVEHSLPFYHIPTWEMLGSQEGIELHVAYGQGYFTGGKYGVPEGIIPSNSNVFYYKCNITRNILGKKFLWHSRALNLLRKNKYDIVIHQAETKIISMIITLLLARKDKMKFALWGIGDPLKSSPLLDKYRFFLAKKADAFIFYSDMNKNKYLKKGINPVKLFTAKNSINVDEIIRFSSQIKETDISKFRQNNNLTGFTILTMGRQIERKKNEWLIEAVNMLLKNGKNINIVIIGDGPKLNTLKQLVTKLKINNKVVFTGKLVGINNIAPWFASSDIVVAPAQVGHLATEAHAYGKPIILSDNFSVQGPESQILIPNKTGLLYKHGSLKDLADKITILYNERDIIKEKYFKRCQERARDFAGTKIMVNGFMEAIKYLSNY